MIEPITVIVTSCGRLDLLEKTLDSCNRLSTYPNESLDKFIIHEDSGDNKTVGQIELRFHSAIVMDGNRLGLSKSLDRLTRCVSTEYYFHTENDWLYDGNPNFIQDSLAILKNNPDINQVWIRDDKDHSHPLGKPYELNSVMVRDVLKGYQGHWGGFSFNPCVRRLSDYKKYFPNGYAEFGDEALCSKHVERIGYKAVSLVNSACKHIGYGRHTDNFKV